jgi:hypothetical protein
MYFVQYICIWYFYYVNRLLLFEISSTKMAVLQDVEPCSLAEVYRRFSGKLLSTYTCSAVNCHTTRYNTLEDSQVQTATVFKFHPVSFI